MKQIKNLVCSLLLSVCGATMFTACSEDNEAIDAKDLELSKSELVFLAEPGEAQTVTFTANADWKATSEQGWILIDTPVGKKGESTVSVSVKQNPEKVSRQGNVIITEPSTGKMASFKVTQEAEGVNFAVSKETGELAIDNENKVISDRISVVANFDYDIQIKDVDWITYSIDEATKDIIFYADNEKATTEAKDIVVNFVPEEENVETKSWTLKWGGFTPTVEFYKDEACTQLIGKEGIVLEESMNGFQAPIFVKSNVSWILATKLENSILTSVDNSEEGGKIDRVFMTCIKLFAVFNNDKLSNIDQALDLSFEYNVDNKSVLKVIKEATSNFIEINKKDFDVIKGNGLVGDYPEPMFDAIPGDGKVTSLEFRLTTFYDTKSLTAVFLSYGKNKLCKEVVSVQNLTCSASYTDSNSGLKEHKYLLSVPDRTQDQGSDRYYMLCLVNDYDENTFLTEYFVYNDERGGYELKYEKKSEIGNIVFGQYAYFTEHIFEEPNWQDSYTDPSQVEISFITTADPYNDELFISEDENENFVLNVWGFPNLTEDGDRIKLTFSDIVPNTENQMKTTKLYIGGILNGKTTIKKEITLIQSAAK